MMLLLYIEGFLFYNYGPVLNRLTADLVTLTEEVLNSRQVQLTTQFSILLKYVLGDLLWKPKHLNKKCS